MLKRAGFFFQIVLKKELNFFSKGLNNQINIIASTTDNGGENGGAGNVSLFIFEQAPGDDHTYATVGVLSYMKF